MINKEMVTNSENTKCKAYTNSQVLNFRRKKYSHHYNVIDLLIQSNDIGTRQMSFNKEKVTKSKKKTPSLVL